MSDIIQHQDPQEFPSNIIGNGSRPPSREEKHGALSRTNPKDIRKAAGPRTAQGKKRSNLNALKHGLLSKDLLLGDESRAEYASLLSGLQEDLQPQGKLESVLVENLAALFWRKRRVFQAETAVISQNVRFTAPASAWKLYDEAWEASRNAITSGGLLKHRNNPFVVREAIEILTSFRGVVDAFGFRKDCYALQKLYGQNQDGGIPRGLRLRYENFAGMAELLERSNKTLSDDTSKSEPSKDDIPVDAELRKEMVGLIDDEIEGLTGLEKRLKADEIRGAEYKTSAAVIPGPEVSDRLIRYETHLSREIDRALNQLERLQRIRRGQPLPPQLDVNVT